MTTDGHKFLDELSRCPAKSFERKFLNKAVRLGLGDDLNRDELGRLLGASLLAAACNCTLNDQYADDNLIDWHQERRRTNLERSFMDARAHLFESTGWRCLPVAQREAIQRTMLQVQVSPERLAW